MRMKIWEENLQWWTWMMISVRRPPPLRRPWSWPGSTSPTRASSPPRPAALRSPGWGSSSRPPHQPRTPPGPPGCSHGRPGNLSLKWKLRSVKVLKWGENLWENYMGASIPILSLHLPTPRLKTEKDNSTGETWEYFPVKSRFLFSLSCRLWKCD